MGRKPRRLGRPSDWEADLTLQAEREGRMEEGGKKRGRERGRSTRFGCPSLSHNRALKLCRRGLPLTMAAATAARFSWNDTLLLSKWVSGGGVFLTCPVPPRTEPPPYGQVRKKETGAFCSWPVISGTESALWTGAGGRREHRPLGWTARNRVCAPQV